jgi:predicted enzyme related to lactoylglutathione lyase
MASAFIWYELMTSDADAAQRFYGDVVGWTFDAGDTPGMDYRHIKAPDGQYIGGVLPLTDQMRAGGARPAWVGYVSVTDVDATVSAIRGEGGTALMPAMTMDKVGRMAMVADPQGSPFYVMTPTPPPDRPDEKSTAFSRTALGHCAWNELATPNPKAALSFYAKHFGWTDGGTMPMGEAGDYQFLNDADGMIGAIMSNSAGQRPPLWTYYFRVADISAAQSTIGSNGGTIMHGPQAVPGGDHILIAGDPQGAMFAVVGQKK